MDLHRQIEQQYASKQGCLFYKTVMGDGGFDIHYGRYANSRTSMRQATEAATTRLLELAESLTSSAEIRSVIDLGSGRGGSAHSLVQRRGWTITCVDLCDSHLRENIRRAEELGIDGQINTWQGSFEALPDGWTDRFDMAWAQESLCHAEDLTKAVAGMVRVTRPCGVVVFSDVMVSSEATPDQEKAFSSVNAIVRLKSPEQYRQILIENGLREILFEDWSEHLESNFKKMLEQIEIHRAELVHRGVDPDHLTRFSSSLQQRLAGAGKILRWGAYVAKNLSENP